MELTKLKNNLMFKQSNQAVKTVKHLIVRFNLLICMFLFLGNCVQSPKYHKKYFFFAYFGEKKIDTTSRMDFQILSEHFASDSQNIYFDEQILKGVDRDSFVVLNDYYLKDKNFVYYYQITSDITINSPKVFIILIPLDLTVKFEKKLNVDIVKDADPKTFSPFPKNKLDYGYAIDKHHLYYMGSEVTFVNQMAEVRFLEKTVHPILITPSEVIYQGKIISKDVGTFQVFGNYAKDKQNCFFIDFEKMDQFPCLANQLSTLEYNEQNPWGYVHSDYAKDLKNVYYQGKVIEGADPKTFTLLEGDKDHCCLAKDKKNRYNQGIQLN
ncbi:DKNYY domain-containing protein [Leptospira jelokensis]|uniref:DKNYY domain-containing protein n=1 Tax=Leptospira jelokensis TaxID=2484931 RepID=UPI001090B95F|nr:DKNYY domain-containing protein [Leptospira jelokensis]TGM06488.1 hypothetical protein EHQ79_00575 [Leptospira jelokensis]